MIRNDLSYQEKAEVIPIGVVYEPIYDENVPQCIVILPVKFIQHIEATPVILTRKRKKLKREQFVSAIIARTF